MSPFPWRISLCTGDALQFIVTDADGGMVMMTECYDQDDMMIFLSFFQRNQEITVDPDSFTAAVEGQKLRKALEALGKVNWNTAKSAIKRHQGDVVAAAEELAV
jgi:hypothetical protein